MDITIGTAAFRLVTTERSAEWTAHALRSDTGERFGIETRGASADQAIAQLTSWLGWQHEHTQALDDLQQAERAYHRAMAGAAFAASSEGAGAASVESKASLEAVDAARARLDDVRARRPNV